MASTKFSDFCTPSPLSAFQTNLQYFHHPTSFFTSAFEVPPTYASLLNDVPLPVGNGVICLLLSNLQISDFRRQPKSETSVW